MPDGAVARPLRELHFDDVLRRHPVCVSPEPSRRRRIERCPLDLDLLQLPPQLETELVAPTGAGANLPGKTQGVALVIPDEYRSYADARTRRVGESANDELLAL